MNYFIICFLVLIIISDTYHIYKYKLLIIELEEQVKASLDILEELQQEIDELKDKR